MPAEQLATPGQDHWFDEFTKRLATAPDTRRHFLELGVAGGILASWASILRIPMALAQTPPRETRPPLPPPIPPSGAVPAQKGRPAFRLGPRKPISETIGPCSIRRDGQQSAFNYAGQISVDNTALRFTLQIQHQLARASISAAPTLESTIVTEITYGSQSVVRAEHHFSPTAIERNAAVRGTMEIRCGSLVTGLRTASLTFQGGQVSGTVDGKAIAPAPIARNLEIRSLHYSDGSAVPAPQFDQRLQSAVPQLQTKAEAEMRTCSSGGVRPDAEPIANFQNTPIDAYSPSCQSYYNGCQVALNICLVGACTFSLCLGAPACYVVFVGCLASGFIPGAGCCQTPCYPFSCCDNNQHCCGSDVCCGPDQVCAMAQYGACCGKDAPVGCGDETDVICCGPGTSCCAAGDCCPPDTVCLPYGSCCPSNLFCNGACCPTGLPCEKTSTGAGVCCDRPLCGDVCCNGQGATCFNGRCGVGAPCGTTFCIFERCCNGVCCEFNQTCVNGKCTTATCPPGQVPCPVTPGMCCPPNLQCCAATKTCCDPAKTECCGARGCVPSGTCIQ